MKKFLIACLAAPALAGCVTASETTALIPQAALSLPTDSRLNEAVSVTTLSQSNDSAFSAQVSDEALADALTAALRQNGLLSVDEGVYSVVPRLVHLEQPMAGFDMTVTATINYLVKATDTGSVVLDKTISSTFTAGATSAFAGATRVRLANEGAVRDNISEFITFFADWAEDQ